MAAVVKGAISAPAPKKAAPVVAPVPLPQVTPKDLLVTVQDPELLERVEVLTDEVVRLKRQLAAVVRFKPEPTRVAPQPISGDDRRYGMPTFGTSRPAPKPKSSR